MTLPQYILKNWDFEHYFLSNHSVIGGNRWLGDRAERAVNETSKLFEKPRASGLPMGRGGLYGKVVRTALPMTVDKSAIDEAVRILDVALTGLQKEGKFAGFHRTNFPNCTTRTRNFGK